jgi:hypothetical protein
LIQSEILLSNKWDLLVRGLRAQDVTCRLVSIGPALVLPYLIV